jgi:hypothetical protein
VYSEPVAGGGVEGAAIRVGGQGQDVLGKPGIGADPVVAAVGGEENAVPVGSRSSPQSSALYTSPTLSSSTRKTELGDPATLVCRDTGAAAVVDLGLVDPMAE